MIIGGDDQCFGGDNDDTLIGGAGQDRLSGDAGTDTLASETGDDNRAGEAQIRRVSPGRFELACLVILAVLGCGKSVQHEPLLSTTEAGASATGGGETSRGTGATGGADATAGVNSAGRSPGGAGGMNTAGGSAAVGGMGGLGSALLCPGPTYVALKGELPGFGTDLKFSAGCERSRVAPYPTAASYAQGRGKALRVVVDACSDDGTQELSLTVAFQADARGRAMLTGARFDFAQVNADGTATFPPLDATVSVTETAKPVMNWLDTITDLSAGVGAKYEGSFSVDGSSGPTPVHITGTFSVCHVADLIDDSV